MTLPDFLTQDADGEIHLTGHRIGLYTVVRCHTEGRSADQIADEFPSLTLDLVRKVVAFYRDNRAQVDGYVEAYRGELERQEAAYVPGPGAVKVGRLVERIRQADARHRGDPAWSSLSPLEKLRRIEQESPRETP